MESLSSVSNFCRPVPGLNDTVRRFCSLKSKTMRPLYVETVLQPQKRHKQPTVERFFEAKEVGKSAF